MTIDTKESALLLASADRESHTSWDKLFKPDFRLHSAYDWTHTILSLHKYRPALLVLDSSLPNKKPARAVGELVRTASDTSILVIDDDLGEEEQIEILRSGARGCCKRDVSGELLKRAVNAILNGEIWTPRKLVPRIIYELARTSTSHRNGMSEQQRSSLDTLTPRELEVAHMVHLGGNNKHIARELSISERTVKAHMSAILRKLNLENRLHLVLFLEGAADSEQTAADAN